MTIRDKAGDSWDLLKEIWGDLYLIALSSWTLFVLIWIGLFGEMRAMEPNHWILRVEYVLVGGGVILGVERLIKDIIAGRRAWRKN